MRRRWPWVFAAITAILVALAVFAFGPHIGPVASTSIERLAVYQDPALLRQAWAQPVARRYGPAGYMYQRNPSACGPTSIADLLHSEGRDVTPAQVLEGSGIRTIFGILPGGLTLDEEAALLRKRTGAPVTVLRGLSLAAFRAEMARSNDPGRRIIVNFTRQPLFGRGHGHFSPVLGYLPERDLVFVGDVNGDFRPWLVPAARLYEAVNTIDLATHAKRGVLEVVAPATGTAARRTP